MADEERAEPGRRERPDREVIGLLLQGREATIFKRILPQVMKRHPRATRSAVFRELIGLDHPFFTQASERAAWARLPKRSVAERPGFGRPAGSKVVDCGGKKTVAPPDTLTA